MQNDYTRFSKHNNFNNRKQDEIILNETVEMEEVVNDVVEEAATAPNNTENTITDFVELPKEEVDTLSEDDVIEIEDVNNIIDGIVFNCSSLNVRKEASKSSEVVEVIESGSKVLIEISASTDDFYKVTTNSGTEGYCMKKFIDVK